MIEITKTISIDESEIKEVFSRAGGPGGQHVNKVETAVQLRFDIGKSKLPEYVKKRLKKLAGARVTNEGILIISSKESRRRELNRLEATNKLVELIKEASKVPKKRIKIKPGRAKIEKRIEENKARAAAKKMREKPSNED